MSKKEKETTILADEMLGKSEAFVLKYKKAIIGGTIAIIACVVAFLAYTTLVVEPKEKAAKEAMYPAEHQFINGEFETALNGDGVNLGFLAIINEYAGTDAANLANAYAGVCYAQTGNYDEAIKHLEEFDGNDQVIAPAMKHTLGTCYSHKENYDKAIELVLEAAEDANNSAVTPDCWFDAAAMYLAQGKKAEALELYNKIEQQYPNSHAAQLAEIQLSIIK